MCSPKVAEIVRERTKNHAHKGNSVSRRDFFKLGGVTAAGLALASALPARVARAQSVSEIIDLTHVFATNVPTYLLGEGPTRETFVTVENDGFYIQKWNFGEHAGTHMDFPAHFVSGAETVDVYDHSLLVSPAVVIDISAKAAENADAALEVADIEGWESENGEIPAGAVVFLYSAWDEKWSDPVAFRNADENDVQHYPGFSPEAATFLVEERDIHGVGVDTLSLDPGNSTTFDAHVTFLSAGKYGIEGVANLASLIGKQATVIAGVPRWEEGSGGPARILALVGE
jgi:kynurenine formamidase